MSGRVQLVQVLRWTASGPSGRNGRRAACVVAEFTLDYATATHRSRRTVGDSASATMSSGRNAATDTAQVTSYRAPVLSLIDPRDGIVL